MYAIRVARGYTGKSKLAVFDGSYNGAHDYVLVTVDKDSPRDRPTFSSNLAGIPSETLDTVIMLPYRHEAAFDIIREHKDELAIVLIDAVQGSNPRLDCGDFLKELQEVCRECNVLLLMDEVITGFRMAYGGAQEFYGITPDLATYGKAVGGGMPIGAIAGPSHIMDVFSLPTERSGGAIRGRPVYLPGVPSAAIPSLWLLAPRPSAICGTTGRYISIWPSRVPAWRTKSTSSAWPKRSRRR